MSRILRRPMFRGGKVDSRGTGITSGLMDTPKYATGGRVGYQNAGVVTGGDLLSKAKSLFLGPYFNDPNFKPKSIPYIEGGGFKFLSPKEQSEGLIKIGESIDERTPRMDELGIDELAKPVKYSVGQEAEMKKSDLETGEGDLNLTETDKKGLDEFYKSLDIKETVGDYKGGVPDKKTVVPDITTDAITGNQEQTTEIDPKQLMKENAELFKELLGEGNKKKLKDARIGDVSDYLLKFFEGTQKEGATLGSAAADVAAFATSKPSATEKAREAIKKTDQTATALAINDYIAGKRSKEDIAKALSLARAKVSLTEGTLGDKILKAKGSGPVTVTVIRDVLRSEPEYSGKRIEEFDSSKKDFTGLEYEAGDENKIFIDTITKETFIYEPSIKSFKRIY